MRETIDDLVMVGTKAIVSAGQKALELQPQLRHRVKGTVQFKEKGKNSPSTIGDVEAEKTLVEIIHNAYPHHKIHGEELGLNNSNSTSHYIWHPDPIDATWSYMSHEMTWCVTLTLLKDNDPIIGIVYHPPTNQLYLAVNGRKSILNEEELPMITKSNKLRRGVVNYHLQRDFIADRQSLSQMFEDKKFRKLITQGGSPNYALALVAQGVHHTFIMGYRDRNPDPWDLAPGVMLVRGADGKVTDERGVDINPLTHNSYIIASLNPLQHWRILKLLDQYHFGKR